MMLGELIREIFVCYPLRDALIVLGSCYGGASLRDLGVVFKMDHSSIGKIIKKFLAEEERKGEHFLAGESPGRPAKQSPQKSTTDENSSRKKKKKSPCKKCKKQDTCQALCPEVEKLLPEMEDGFVIPFDVSKNDDTDEGSQEEQIDKRFFDGSRVSEMMFSTRKGF
jgi:hypothetical protein